MDFSEIRQLMHEFSKLPINKMSLELDNLKLSLEKQAGGSQETVSQPAVCQPITVVTQTSGGNAAALDDECRENPDEVAVCSPVVGVFYATPSPDSDPFVSVGQHVEKGQTLCIVEAMKMMNEIPAPISGRITRIVVTPEEAVEYNQPLMYIQKE